MVRSVLRVGAGKADVSIASFGLGTDTRLDLDRYDGGRLTLWIGDPIVLRLDLDPTAMERLHSFLGAALQELEDDPNRPALGDQSKSEAVCE